MFNCQLCGQPIEGVDQLAAIWAGESDAHYECYYPQGTCEPLELPAWAIAKIAAVKPELAAKFQPRAATDRAWADDPAMWGGPTVE